MIKPLILFDFCMCSSNRNQDDEQTALVKQLTRKIQCKCKHLVLFWTQISNWSWQFMPYYGLFWTWSSYPDLHWTLPLWSLLLFSLTYYDIMKMSNDIAMCTNHPITMNNGITLCTNHPITMNNGIIMSTNHPMTMDNGITMSTNHPITKNNGITMSLFYYVVLCPITILLFLQ